MVADWEGVGKKAIRRHRQCAMVGRVYIIVGEYAGVEYYRVALMQKLRGGDKDCLRDYVYPCGGTAEERSRETILAEVTRESAELAVGKKQMVFSRGQKEAITALVQMEGLFAGLKGPPRSSKGLLAPVAARSQKLKVCMDEGQHIDAGRRNIARSHGCVTNSFHVTAECLDTL